MFFQKVMLHATTWMNLGNFMVSKRSQSQKPKYYVAALYEMSRVGKSAKTGRLMVA